MENSKKLAIVLVSSSLLAPLVLLFFSLETGFFDSKFGVVLLMTFIMLPLAAAGVYMWITGKGQWAISGYNTMGKNQQAYYDGEKLAKDVGKFLVIISLICIMLGAIAYFPNTMLVFAVLMGALFAAIAAFLVYAGNGKRYLKDQMRTPPPPSKEDRKVMWAIAGVSLSSAVVVFVLVFLLMGSGSVNASANDEKLYIDAPMVNRSLNYEDIVSVELCEDMDLGSRVGGFGGSKVLSGNFNNKEFGDYTLACYKDIRTYIVVEPVKGKMLVFNRNSVEETVDFYNELVEKIDRT